MSHTSANPNFSSFPKDKILDYSELKAFVSDIVAQMMISVFDTVNKCRKHCGKSIISIFSVSHNIFNILS